MQEQVPWSEAIERMIKDNGGVTSLEKMYHDIHKYRDVSTNREWKATLRGILYREMQQKGHIVRIGLGVFAIPGVSPAKGVFQDVAAGRKVRLTEKHSSAQGMLIELGNFYGYETYTADPNAYFDGKKLGSVATLNEVPPFTGFPQMLEQAKRVDVIWFTRRRLFPQHCYEVEVTTGLRSGMLRLYQLLDFNPTLFIVADARKESIFRRRLEEEPFSEVTKRFHFRSFESLTALYQAAVVHYLQREKFFQEVAFRPV